MKNGHHQLQHAPESKKTVQCKNYIAEKSWSTSISNTYC